MERKEVMDKINEILVLLNDIEKDELLNDERISSTYSNLIAIKREYELYGDKVQKEEI